MTALNDLLPAGLTCEAEAFEPCAMYYAPLDCITYLREDISYRADRVDQFMTILWHPYEDRAVGVKLKGGRYLFELVRAALEPLGHTITDDHFLPLMSAIRLAMTVRGGEQMTEHAEGERMMRQKRRSDLYRQAMDLVGEAKIDRRQFGLAA